MQERRREWTWKRIHQYHSCNYCGYINGSREEFKLRGKVKYKNMVCQRCDRSFCITKKNETSLAPLFEQE